MPSWGFIEFPVYRRETFAWSRITTSEAGGSFCRKSLHPRYLFRIFLGYSKRLNHEKVHVLPFSADAAIIGRE